MSTLNRRAFVGSFALAAGLACITRAGALASVPQSLDRWAQNLADLNRDLAAGRIALTEWQDRLTLLHAGVELAELRRYLDFDRLTKAMALQSRVPEHAELNLPPEIDVGGIARPWSIRFVGLKRGASVVPHVHNNMVSAHLVVDGEFHARTFDRMIDLPDPAKGDAVLLRPMRNETLGAGGLITMSDQRENSHWLVAESDRAFTFDVELVDVAKWDAHKIPAGEQSMIFIDPTGEEDGYGLITAPVITYDQSLAKFAA